MSDEAIEYIPQEKLDELPDYQICVSKDNPALKELMQWLQDGQTIALIGYVAKISYQHAPKADVVIRLLNIKPQCSDQQQEAKR